MEQILFFGSDTGPIQLNGSFGTTFIHEGTQKLPSKPVDVIGWCGHFHIPGPDDLRTVCKETCHACRVERVLMDLSLLVHEGGARITEISSEVYENEER